MSGFPNLFNIAGPGSTSAFTAVMGSIEHHVDWNAHVNAVGSRSVFPSCNSWYLGANIPGKPRMFMPLLGLPPGQQVRRGGTGRGYEGVVLA